MFEHSRAFQLFMVSEKLSLKGLLGIRLGNSELLKKLHAIMLVDSYRIPSVS